MKWIAIILLLALAAPIFPEPPKFAPVDGDRVVFLGGTLVERDQSFGYFEAMLDACFKDVHFTFRDLGWSGDTVWGESRAGFGTPKDGYASLLKQVNDCKPTILLVNYGANESFDGKAGLSHFVEGYDALLDDLAKTGAKIWLVTPNCLEDHGRPLPDPAAHNELVGAYSTAIRDTANRHGCGLVDLEHLVPPHPTDDSAGRPMTDDAMHFNAYGASQFASAVLSQLAPTKDATGGLTTERFEALRRAVVEKNREYFYRWRPQNETYIFGFRKKEQGRNAVEIPQFDPIVEKLEAKVEELKKGR